MSSVKVPPWVATALDDAKARAARRLMCHELSSALTALGRFLWIGGWFFGDEGTSLGVLAQIGGEIATSCTELLQADHFYAASALVRQLVEAEYLAWVFAEDDQVGTRWLNATPEQVRSLFSPKSLRNRAAGRFRDSEYWAHCEFGGHPNPKAAFLLPDHAATIPPEGAWVDLGQHLERLWALMVATLDHYQWRDAVSAVDFDRVQSVISEWHESDALAARLSSSAWP